MGQMILKTRRPDETVYRGTPGSNAFDIKAVVTVEGEPLPLRRDIAKLSDRFNWGYWGAGPGQLTLAILADAVGKRAALEAWERFHREFIEQLKQDEPFAITAGDVRAFVRKRVLDPKAVSWPVPRKKGWWESLKELMKKPA